MCANYRPVVQQDRLITYFGVACQAQELLPEAETWPLGLAPFIRLHEDGSGNKVIDNGKFGLLPYFAKEIAYGRKTYNARSETVDKLPSFRDSWARGRRCIIPAEVIYENCHETGKSVRWGIQGSGGVPLGVAGIYNQWQAPDGGLHWSFTMLTVNADGHPIYQRMHRPGDEKRMVVILAPDDYEQWLQCSPNEAKALFKQWHGPLDAFPTPLSPPKRARSLFSEGETTST